MQYRVSLSTAGLSLSDPHTRADVLLDLYALLSEASGVYTFDQAVIHLKAKYDTENTLRSREEVQEVVKLIKYADVLAAQPQSWQLDALTVKAGLQAQDFVDRSESAYLMVMLQNNLELKPDLLAQLLFGTLDQRARVMRLITLARQVWAAALESARKARVPLSEGACYLNDIEQLLPILAALEKVELTGPLSLERAAQLNQEGLQIRMTDFEKAREYFIQAARMVCDLMRVGSQGAGRMELEWYLASYCAASAGQHYFRSEYTQAKEYYLAFFALAKETEPVWEKVQRLVEPLLSFYFIIAAGLTASYSNFVRDAPIPRAWRSHSTPIPTRPCANNGLRWLRNFTPSTRRCCAASSTAWKSLRKRRKCPARAKPGWLWRVKC